MSHRTIHRARSKPAKPTVYRVATVVPALLAAGPGRAHEAWLLTPSEVDVLSRMPMPDLFTSGWTLAFAAAIGLMVAVLALEAERRLHPLEDRILAPLARLAPGIGPLAVRLSLALMLALAALGLLPRHGTPPGIEPTLFVPDMQLSLAPGWDWLAPAQLALSGLLALGLLTRASGLAVIALSALGLAIFGSVFLAYAPHFAAPGLLLAVFGGGRLALDGRVFARGWPQPDPAEQAFVWKLCLVLMGGGFVYLAITYKLTQPTLLIAILSHGEVPLLGLPLDVAALVMTGVELIAGTLLALGRLTRPIALFLVGAFTFFALTIGETPLFHANLYGVMAMLILSGAAVPALQVRRAWPRRQREARS